MRGTVRVIEFNETDKFINESTIIRNVKLLKI